MSTQTFTEIAPKGRAAAPAEVPVAPAADRPELGAETPPAWKWALVLVPLAALMPLLWTHAEHLWTLPHYQFFPFVLLGAGVLAWTRWKSAPRAAGNLTTAFGLLIVAWVVLALGEAVESAMLAVVSLQLILAAGLLALGGYVFFRALLPAWAFLWILVPLPFGLDRQLVVSMQQLASTASSSVLDVLGVVHVLDGNVVRITQKPLFVEEACAGLNSLFTLAACSLFLILWMRRSWVRGVLLMVASVGWVLVCNVLRIVIIAFMLDRFGPDWDLSDGLRHSILGFGCFSLAVLLIWSTDRFFLFFLPRWNSEAPAASVPAPAADPEQPTIPKTVRFADLCRLASLPLATAFGIVLVLHFAIHSFILPDVTASPEFGDRVQKIGKKSLPTAIEQHRMMAFGTDRRGTGSAFGENSKQWIYGKGTQFVGVSLDYPFPKFHDLAPCYVGRGWSVDLTIPHHELPNSKAPPIWHEHQMHKSGGRFGYVVFAEFNAQGDSLDGESRLLGALLRHERALQAICDRIFRPEEFKAPQPMGPAYQMQTFVESERPMTDADRQEIQQVFFGAVAKLRQELFGKK
ncbi:MAG TPA: exosortase U [Gemmataceae bacterium]|nr:exosortase U [Gemmataceae bacterium]